MLYKSLHNTQFVSCATYDLRCIFPMGRQSRSLILQRQQANMPQTLSQEVTDSHCKRLSPSSRVDETRASSRINQFLFPILCRASSYQLSTDSLHSTNALALLCYIWQQGKPQGQGSVYTKSGWRVIEEELCSAAFEISCYWLFKSKPQGQLEDSNYLQSGWRVIEEGSCSASLLID